MYLDLPYITVSFHCEKRVNMYVDATNGSQVLFRDPHKLLVIKKKEWRSQALQTDYNSFITNGT